MAPADALPAGRRPGRSGRARRPAVPARKARRPAALVAVSAAVAAALALPLVFLLIEAHGAGTAEVTQLIFRRLTADLLWNTVRLTVVVTIGCAVIGTAAAWCVERTDLPGRRVWAVLVVVPLAIPDFVVSFGWASLWTWVHGFRGAVVVMTLAVYPLVYLPVAASLRAADPGQEEVARSLGVGRVRTFVRVTLGQARGAILGGCLLVALVLLAEYGAFEILGYQTFTTEIFTEFSVSFSVPAACALSLVLVALSLLVLAGEGMLRGRGRVARSGPLAQRRMPPQRLGRATLPVLAGFGVLTALALGVPVGSSVWWMFEGGAHAIAGVSAGQRRPAHRGLRGVRRGAGHRGRRCRSRCWRSGTPAGSGTSWSAAPTWCWPCPAWSPRSRCPTSPSATAAGCSTRARRCSSSATRSCSSRWPWSG